MHRLGEVTHEICPPVGVRWHEYADLFPWLDGRPREELRDSIREHGVLEPIVFLGEFVLDGRNRYDVARELGIEYPRVDYLGDDPLGFVIAKNLSRRHLNESQRAMIAAKLAKMPQGARTDLAPIGAMSDAGAAAALNVGERSVERAKTVQRDGAAELVTAVEQGKVSVSAAADLASLPVEQQIKALAEQDPKAFGRVIKEARAVKQVEKKARRGEREVELAAKQRALPQKRYGVILADPEWKFRPYSEETGMDRSAANHYPVSDLADIQARDVESIAAEDCVLGLWAISSMLPQALETLAAWGFAYVTHAVWFKQRAGDGRGTGYWFLGEHELLLIGKRGNVVAPAPGTQFRSVFVAPVGEHSEKPDNAHEILEAYFPNLPKIELNSRGPARPGWDTWGNEAEDVEAAA